VQEGREKRSTAEGTVDLARLGVGRRDDWPQLDNSKGDRDNGNTLGDTDVALVTLEKVFNLA